MSNTRYTREQTEAGRKRLAELLPLAEKRAAGGDYELKPASNAGRSGIPFLRTRHLDAVHIRNNGRGWIADICLKDTPPGVPAVLGTPEKMPLATREEAVDMAVSLLAMAVANERKPTPPSEVLSFEFSSLEFRLSAEAVRRLAAETPPAQSVTARREILEEFVYRTLAPHLETPGSFTIDHLAADQRVEFLLSIALLLADGKFRYTADDIAPIRARIEASSDPEPGAGGPGGLNG